MQPEDPKVPEDEIPNFDALDKTEGDAPVSNEAENIEVTEKKTTKKKATSKKTTKKRPTNAAIAKKAGLSASTVSKAINKPESVSEKTRTLVQKAMAELEAEKDVVVKVVSKPKEPKKQSQAKKTSSYIQEVGEYTGTSDYPANQYMQVGTLIDMWADVVEGYANKATEFYETFETLMASRNIKSLKRYRAPLKATGMINPPFRTMLFLARYPVTVTVYVATQGDDLYVSWRAFAKADVAYWKVGVLAAVGALFGLGIANSISGVQNMFRSGFDPVIVLNLGIAITWAVIFFVVVGGWFVFQGFQKYDGDFLAFFREPLNELHADDVASASAVVHKTIIHTADKLGIDTTKLELREPFYKQRKQRRF